jgi:hypothetical protein
MFPTEAKSFKGLCAGFNGEGAVFLGRNWASLAVGWSDVVLPAGHPTPKNDQ